MKFRHPAAGEVVRESLEATEEPRAEMLRERVELEAALRDPRLALYPMPQRLGSLCGIGQPVSCPRYVAESVNNKKRSLSAWI